MSNYKTNGTGDTIYSDITDPEKVAYSLKLALSRQRSVRLPIIIIPEMALVTLIRGVCKAGVTDHTTK